MPSAAKRELPWSAGGTNGVQAMVTSESVGVSEAELRSVRKPVTSRLPRASNIVLLLTALTFSLLGFVIGIWADSFEKLNLAPLPIVTPLTFLGGSFYSINMLPPFRRAVTLFNPVVVLVSSGRWSFFGKSDIDPGVSLGMTLLFMTGYRLKR